MSTKKNRRQSVGIPDVWAICGLYALMLLLFVIPGIVIGDRPFSALQLMQATELYQFNGFPGSLKLSREIAALPTLCIVGLVTTLLLRKGTGKYAFGACIGALLFGLIGVYKNRALAAAGGFAVGAGMLVAAALFFVCIICAAVRRN